MCKAILGPEQRLPKTGKETGGLGICQSLGHPAAAGSPLRWDEEPTHASILSLCDEALQLASPPGQTLALHLELLPLA